MPARDVPVPDLVIYLQAPVDLLKRLMRERAKREDEDFAGPDETYVAELGEAYNHFFFHYTATPLLVVETSHVDLTWGEQTIEDLLRQIRQMGKGTQYYVPR